MWKSGFLAFLLFGVAACDNAAPSATPVTGGIETKSSSGTPIPVSAVEATEVALRKEPRIMDHHVDPAGPIEWQIGVINTGSPEFGYAEYLCMVAKDHGAANQATDVRVVDVNLVAAGKDFRSASLGTVHCADGTRLDDAPAAHKS